MAKKVNKNKFMLKVLSYLYLKDRETFDYKEKIANRNDPKYKIKQYMPYLKYLEYQEMLEEPLGLGDVCPHCGKEECFDEVAYDYAEGHGDRTYLMKCVRCKEKIKVRLVRRVTCYRIDKSNHTDKQQSFD